MDSSPTPDIVEGGSKRQGVGPFVGIIIVVILVIVGGVYFFVQQEIKLHQTPTQEQANS